MNRIKKLFIKGFCWGFFINIFCVFLMFGFSWGYYTPLRGFIVKFLSCIAAPFHFLMHYCFLLEIEYDIWFFITSGSVYGLGFVVGDYFLNRSDKDATE